MMDRYEEAADAFFGELARSSYDNARELFKAMLRELVLKCAVEGGENPSEGLGQWVGGRISICSELTSRTDAALARELGKANPGGCDGLSDAPV